MPPDLIRNAAKMFNSIVEHRINQVIRDGGKELERVLPKILRKAIEDLYKRGTIIQTGITCKKILL